VRILRKGIIEAHGGMIWAKNNKEGRGATFRWNISIPLDRQFPLDD
jgi:K+-sensing histidine kinase KdpD